MAVMWTCVVALLVQASVWPKVGAAKEDTYQHIFQQSSLSKLLNLGIGSTNAVKSALWRHRPHFCATLRFY